MATTVQLWRPAGSLIGVEHGLNVKPDVHAETTERTLLCEGPIWNRDGVPWCGPLKWRVLPSRWGPPDWRMPLASLAGRVADWNAELDRLGGSEAIHDEVVTF